MVSPTTQLCGKWLKEFLEPEVYEEFTNCYSSSDYEDIWNKMVMAGELARRIGKVLADKLQYDYPVDYDENVCDYVNKIRQSI